MLLELPKPIPTDLSARIEQLRDRLSGNDRFDVVVLFGSLARGTAHSWSDVDVGVLTQDPPDFSERSALAVVVESVLGRPVDIVDLRRAPLPLRGRAVRDAVTILSTNPDAWTRFATHVTTRWLDYRPLYKRAVRLAVRRLAEGTT